MILGRSPLRISFAGGGTDLEEYHNKFDGYALTFTINKFTHVIAKLRDDDKFQGFSPDFASHHPPKSYRKIEPVQGHEIVVTTLKQMRFRSGIDIFFSSDVAPGSGLGASSSLTSNLVNVICNIQRKNWSKNKIAMKAYDIGHNVLKWNVGKQDEFSSVFGGLNLLKFTKTKVSVEEIHLNKSTLQELKNNSMLFYIGKRKFSSDKKIKIASTTIDQITKDYKKVNFIKMDIEGAELKALIGAEMTLKKHKPILSLEVNRNSFFNIYNFLKPFGYKPYAFDQNGNMLEISSIMDFCPTLIFKVL